MEHFLWYCDFETVLMGYLANFLKEAFVAQCPSIWKGRCTEVVFQATSRINISKEPSKVMELAKVKLFCQGHLSDGLVTIVGSGLSVAEGISGMSKSKLPAGFVVRLQKEEFNAVQELAIDRVS